MFRLSIVIPMYNVEQYIEKCLLSIIGQIEKDCEVIIINDGSMDKSLLLAEKVTKGIDNIRIYSQQNQGLSASRNVGTAMAQGEYIWYVDSDDWILPHAVGYILNAIKCNNVDFITVASVTNEGQNHDVRRLIKTESPQRLLQTQMWHYGLKHYIIRRDFIARENLFFMEGIYHEDNEYTPRMIYLAKTCFVTNEILYVYNIRPNSILTKTNIKKSYDLITVAESLSVFKKECVREPEMRRVFNDLIAADVNQSLQNCFCQERVEQKRFDEYIFERRKRLLDAFRGSRHLAYKIEVLLFMIFSQYVAVYRFMVWSERQFRKIIAKK